MKINHPSKPCHLRGNGDLANWIPAFAGMTALIFLLSSPAAVAQETGQSASSDSMEQLDFEAQPVGTAPGGAVTNPPAYQAPVVVPPQPRLPQHTPQGVPEPATPPKPRTPDNPFTFVWGMLKALVGVEE